MNGALRQVRDLRAKVAGISDAKAARYYWREEDGTLTLDGVAVPESQVTDKDFIMSWDWEGTSEPPTRRDDR